MLNYDNIEVLLTGVFQPEVRLWFWVLLMQNGLAYILR